MVFQAIYSFFFECDDMGKKVQFGHPYVPYAIISFYIVFCKWIGPALMKNRKPFVMRNVLIGYNFFQMLANTYLVIRLVEALFAFWNFRCEHIVSPGHLALIQERRLANWHLYLIKYIDLLDAVFFILRKKENQVTFLHLFHHVVICTMYYLYIATLDVGYYLIVALSINSFIHIIMYLYYFLAAFGPGMQKYLWWKKYLTSMQMIQFVIVLLYMLINFANGCQKTEKTEIAFFLFVLSLLILFANFYKKSFKTE